MADLSQLTDEQLYEMAGITPPTAGAAPSAAPDYSQMSDEQLMQIAGVQPQRTWGDTFSDFGKSAAKGASGLGQLLSPFLGGGAQLAEIKRQAEIGEPQYHDAGLMERALGKGVEMLPYAALGGGAIPALTTGIGGEVAKDMGAPEWAGQIAGGLGGGLTQALAGKIARSAPKAAAALENRALGFTKTDLGMSARRQGLDAFDFVKQADGSIKKVPATQITTSLEDALERTKADGLLKNGTAPEQVFQTAAVRQEDIGKQIGKLVGAADTELKKAGGKVTPTFERAQNYIDTLASTNDQDKLQKLLDTFKSNLSTKGDGSIGRLQKEKILLGKKTYAAGSEFVKPFDEALTADLRATVESSVGGAADRLRKLNELHGSYQEISKKVTEMAAKGGLPDPTGFLANFFKTTGGVMGGAIAGGIAGSGYGAPVSGLVLGAVGSGLMKASQSPSARRAQSAAYKALAAADKSIPGMVKGGGIATSITPLIGQRTQQQLQERKSPQAESLSEKKSLLAQPSKEKQKVSSPDFTSDPDISKSRNSAYASAYKRSSFMDTVLDRAEGKSMDKAPVAVIEEQIDADPYYSALYEAESGRNPLAKNPDSSATGGFQFIRRTAQSLGLDDPTDLGKSFEAVQKLTKEIDAIAKGDPFLRYAGHYLGSPLLKKWLEKKSLTETEEEQVRYLKAKALPRFQKIYKRIAQKKSGVLEA